MTQTGRLPDEWLSHIPRGWKSEIRFPAWLGEGWFIDFHLLSVSALVGRDQEVLWGLL